MILSSNPPKGYSLTGQIAAVIKKPIFSPTRGSPNPDLAVSPQRVLRKSMILPLDFSPGTWDVICQRGKDCNHHIGNQLFQVYVENHTDRYVAAQSRQNKSAVITAIVNTIRRGDAVGRAAGRFVTKDVQSGRWHNNDNKVARDKVGNALRDTGKQILSSPPQTRHQVIFPEAVTPYPPTLHRRTTQNAFMLGDSGTFGSSERLCRVNNKNIMFPPPPPFAENNQNLIFPPPPPFAGFQLPPPDRQPMNVHNFETSPLLEERKRIFPTEAFYYAHHHEEQAHNEQTHRQPIKVYSTETSPLQSLEDRKRMFPTEAFNWAHQQQAFNSLTSSKPMLEEEHSLYGNVSTTGGGQMNEMPHHHAMQQQQQHAHESEEMPWEEQMALALEPTPLR